MKQRDYSKYRDFSDMPDDKLSAFADALAEIAKKVQEKETRKRHRALVPSANRGEV